MATATFSEDDAVPDINALNSANKWAELQNVIGKLEGERDSLRNDVARLRNEGQTEPAPTADISHLRAQVDEASQLAKTRLGDVVSERSRNSKLSDELQQRTADLARLSRERFQLQSERNATKSRLLPVEQERDLLVEEKANTEVFVQELQSQLTTMEIERNQALRENAALKSDTSLELEALRADVKTSQQAALEAAEARRDFQRKASVAEGLLHEKVGALTVKRSELEATLVLLEERLCRATKLQESAQTQLASTARELSASLDAQTETSAEVEKLRKQNADLTDRLSHVDGEIWKQLQRDVDIPEGFSVSSLISEVAALRQQVVRETEQRLHVQDLLADVEREVRGRYPMIMAQREELEHFRGVSELLVKKNQEFLTQLEELETARKDAEMVANQSLRSVQILEAHARDMAKQLAVVMQASRPGRVPGMTELDAIERDRRYFRDVQELTEQNEALRRTVVQLREESETSSQRELTLLREDRDKQALDVKQYLSDKAEQMKVLVDTAARLARERDEAQELAHHQASCEKKEIGPQLAKLTEALEEDTRDVRASELKVRQALAAAEARLDFEQSQKRDMELSLKLVEKELGHEKAKRESFEHRTTTLEENVKREKTNVAKSEALLRDARQDRNQLEIQLKSFHTKVQELERTKTMLEAEKSSHGRVVAELQAHMAGQSTSYQELKQDLATSFAKEERFLKEQLQLSEHRQSGLQRTIDDLNAARTVHRKEMDDVKGQAATLSMKVKSLEGQLVDTSQARSSRADVDLPPRPGAPELFEGQEDPGSKALWVSLLESYKSDLQARQEEIRELRDQVGRLQHTQSKHGSEVEDAHHREEQLETRVQDLSIELVELRAALAAKDAATATAQMAGEEKAQEAQRRYETAVREEKRAHHVIDDLQRKLREGTQAHASDIGYLSRAEERCSELESKVATLQKLNGELETKVSVVSTERASEFQALKQQLEHEELHAKTLGEEIRRYQQHLVTITGKAVDPSQFATAEVQPQGTNEDHLNELEVERSRFERDAKVLRDEVADLQDRLGKAQTQVLQLQSNVRRDERAVTKLGYMDLLEDENSRLDSETKSLETRLSEAQAAIVAKESDVEPLKRHVTELTQKTEEAERAAKDAGAKATEWKTQYDELLCTFDADIHESKKLKAEREMWQAERHELVTRNAELATSVQKTTDIEQLQMLTGEKTRSQDGSEIPKMDGSDTTSPALTAPPESSEKRKIFHEERESPTKLARGSSTSASPSPAVETGVVSSNVEVVDLES